MEIIKELEYNLLLCLTRVIPTACCNIEIPQQMQPLSLRLPNLQNAFLCLYYTLSVWYSVTGAQKRGEHA